MQIEKPLVEISGMFSLYPSANADFSPNGEWIVCATSINREETTSKSMLCFYQLPKLPAYTPGTPVAPAQLPVNKMSIAINVVDAEGNNKPDVSGIYVKWQASINQIFCSTSIGTTKVYFDPRLSKKGAMLTSSRPPKRLKDPSDEVIGEIFNPHALPLFRNDDNMFGEKRGRAHEKKLEAMRARVPQKPEKSGPGKQENTSFFFTKLVMEGRTVDTIRSEDPREALLKFDKVAKDDPIYYGGAYKASQPGNKLHHQTFEEEQEEFKKRQKTSIDI